MDNNEIITLITGANRGMGFEIAKELGAQGQSVLIGSRSLENGQVAAERLVDIGIKAEAIQLDVTSHESVQNASNLINERYGYLNILINNAGAAFDQHKSPSELNIDVIRKDFNINYFGLVDVTQQFIPLLKKGQPAKIINITSMMGSLNQALNPNSEVYHASAVGYQSAKAATNMFTIQLAKEFINNKIAISVNSIDPGIVATNFGGGDPEAAKARGAKTVNEGVARTIELATNLVDSTTATFSNTNGIVPW